MALLEAHLADLNTQLALNSVALSAFGLATAALPAPVAHDDAAW